MSWENTQAIFEKMPSPSPHVAESPVNGVFACDTGTWNLQITFTEPSPGEGWVKDRRNHNGR